MTFKSLGRNWQPPSRSLSTNGPTPLILNYRAVSELKPNPDNPRVHTVSQIRRLARIVDTFGFLIPVIIDDDATIISGEARWRAAAQLGIAEIPTILISHLNLPQRQALMIADNRLAERSHWDDAKLGKLLKQLSISGLDFDMELTGFDTGEIDILIESVELQIGDEANEDQIPLLATTAISKLGDLWILGGHRVLCGNALDLDAYRALMALDRAKMVITDPPYNVKINGHVTGLGKHRHREFAMAAGEMDSASFRAFLTTIARYLVEYSIDGSIHFIFMDWRHSYEILQAGLNTYSELKNICVWSKHNAGMGSFYRSAHEMVFVFKNGRASHQNNIQLGRFGRHRTNIWSYPGANLPGQGSEDGSPLAMHPTVKPVAMIADAILDCSARGDIILDPFLGSGSAVLAAERTGRRCFGMEIDPLYVDLILRRYRKLTGQDPVHATSGKTFTEHEQEADNVIS